MADEELAIEDAVEGLEELGLEPGLVARPVLFVLEDVGLLVAVDAALGIVELDDGTLASEEGEILGMAMYGHEKKEDEGKDGFHRGKFMVSIKFAISVE